MFYSKNSKELVYDLISQANPNIQPALTSANSIVEAVTAVTPSAANGMRNTQARVRAIQGAGYSGSFIVYYNRISLQQVMLVNDWWGGYTNVRIDSYSGNSVHALLPLIAARYGINLNTWDVNNQSLSTQGIADRVERVGLATGASCPAYTGSVILAVYRGKPTLEEQASITALSQAQHFDATAATIAAGMKSAALCTWGLDLTDNKNLINSASAVLSNWSALMGVLANYGVPPMDAPTSNQIGIVVPTTNQYANPNFDRVTIVTGLTGANIQGTAYFHFNL